MECLSAETTNHIKENPRCQRFKVPMVFCRRRNFQWLGWENNQSCRADPKDSVKNWKTNNGGSKHEDKNNGGGRKLWRYFERSKEWHGCVRLMKGQLWLLINQVYIVIKIIGKNRNSSGLSDGFFFV